MEDEDKESGEVVKVKDEWVAEAWVPVETADAHNAAIPCHIKPVFPVCSKRVPNAGLKW